MFIHNTCRCPPGPYPWKSSLCKSHLEVIDLQIPLPQSSPHGAASTLRLSRPWLSLSERQTQRREVAAPLSPTAQGACRPHEPQLPPCRVPGPCMHSLPATPHCWARCSTASPCCTPPAAGTCARPVRRSHFPLFAPPCPCIRAPCIPLVSVHPSLHFPPRASLH